MYLNRLVSLALLTLFKVSSATGHFGTRHLHGRVPRQNHSRTSTNCSSRQRCLKSYDELTSTELSRLIDASGKPASGLYGFNFMWLGSFGGCKKLSKARYFLTFFSASVLVSGNGSSQMFPLTWGLCVPEICTKQDVVEGLEFFLNNISRIPLKPVNVKIEGSEHPEYTAGVILTIIFCGFLITLCVLASILDERKASQVKKQGDYVSLEDSNQFSSKKETSEQTKSLAEENQSGTKAKSLPKGLLYDVANCFSLIRNIDYIFDTKVMKGDLTYLHGIRVLSLFWIIMYHVLGVFLTRDLPLDNPVDMIDFLRRTSASILIQGSLAVVNFFVLSGLLAMYVNLKKAEKNGGSVNWVQFYFHRFWRLTPVYMFAILLFIKLQPFLGDGPLWYKIRNGDSSKCADYWWTNLLYINNFHPESLDKVKDRLKMCIVQTWYLSVDMQLFAISPIFILIVLRYGFKQLAGVAIFLILTSMAIIGGMIADKNLMPSAAIAREDLVNYFRFRDQLYNKPYGRLPCYVVGIILGFILFKYWDRKIHLKWYFVLSFWCIGIGTCLAIIYAPSNLLKKDPHVWSKAEKVIFGSTKWILWSIFLGWLIFACNYGYAGCVRSFLAAKFWIPLSRINYSTFIIHYGVARVLAANVETPIHFTVFTLVTYILSCLVLSYLTGFLLTVVVELPCANLEHLLTRRWKT